MQRRKKGLVYIHYIHICGTMQGMQMRIYTTQWPLESLATAVNTSIIAFSRPPSICRNIFVYKLCIFDRTHANFSYIFAVSAPYLPLCHSRAHYLYIYLYTHTRDTPPFPSLPSPASLGFYIYIYYRAPDDALSF